MAHNTGRGAAAKAKQASTCTVLMQTPQPQQLGPARCVDVRRRHPRPSNSSTLTPRRRRRKPALVTDRGQTVVGHVASHKQCRSHGFSRPITSIQGRELVYVIGHEASH
eukprot:scaffold1085_cov407-Prasinococcus_capsulatus_cf.AAC.18